MMPNYSKIALTEQAQKLDFQTDIFEKVYRLTEILQFIYETETLKRYIALKGGTAINITVFKLPRLSVDIDLDFTENLTKEEIQVKRNNINDTLERYMSSEGYIRSAKSKSTHILDSLVYSYTNAAGNSDNIKIEINYSLRCHILPLIKRPIETLGIFTPVSVLTLDSIEIYASKITALLTRTAARDLYDVYNMVHFGLFNESQTEFLRRCVVFYLAVSAENTPDVFTFDNIDALTYQDIKMRLKPMLRKKDSFHLEPARMQVKEFLSSLLLFSDNEKQFLTSFRDGKYDPGLLFDDEKSKHLHNHPMVQWKMIVHERHRESNLL